MVRGEAHRLQPRAFDQLAGKLRVPASYLHRCPGDLVARNLNSWLAGIHTDVLIRFDGDEVRAVLSPRYQPVSSLELVRALSRAMPDDTPVRYELTCAHFVAQVLTPESQNGGGLRGGISIGNSETGFRVVEMSALIFRVICLNGLIMGDSEVTVRRRHTHDAAGTLEEIRSMALMAWGRVAGFPGLFPPTVG